MESRWEGARPRIHAHRGASSRCPENTIAAFLAARDLGADGIELDVHATADGHLVVLHDYDLARTTSGTGLVHERELGYVRTLSAGAWFGKEFTTERVPLLEEVLALEGLEFELEVKGLPTTAFVTGIARAVEAAGVADRLQITGFHYLALGQLRRQLPGVLFGLFSPPCQPWMTDHLYHQIVEATALGAGFDVVHLPAALVSRVDVARLHERGLLVQASGPTGDEELVATFDSGVDIVSADDPGPAHDARERWSEGRAGD